MSQASSETLLVVSGDTCATWKAGVPWQDHSLPCACKSFHNSSASFLFDIVSEGSGLLAVHTQKPVPQHIRDPYPPLLYSPLPTPLPSVLSCREWVLKCVSSGQVSEGSQSEPGPGLFTTYWFFSLMSWKEFMVVWICDCLWSSLGCTDRKIFQPWNSQ